MDEVLVGTRGDFSENGVKLVRAGRLDIGVYFWRGAFYAYRNLCPHQGGPACEGKVMPRVRDEIDAHGLYTGQSFDEADLHIVCPWHGYEFKICDGTHAGDPRVKLQRFEVVERQDNIYVKV